MSETETVLDDAKKITPDMLTMIDPDRSIAGNLAFVQAFIQRVVPKNERGDFFQARGNISKAGINRIENALI